MRTSCISHTADFAAFPPFVDAHLSRLFLRAVNPVWDNLSGFPFNKKVWCSISQRPDIHMHHTLGASAGCGRRSCPTCEPLGEPWDPPWPAALGMETGCGPGFVFQELIRQGGGGLGRSREGAAYSNLIFPRPNFGSRFSLGGWVPGQKDPPASDKQSLIRTGWAPGTPFTWWTVRGRSCRPPLPRPPALPLPLPRPS